MYPIFNLTYFLHVLYTYIYTHYEKDLILKWEGKLMQDKKEGIEKGGDAESQNAPRARGVWSACLGCVSDFRDALNIRHQALDQNNEGELTAKAIVLITFSAIFREVHDQLSSTCLIMHYQIFRSYFFVFLREWRQLSSSFPSLLRLLRSASSSALLLVFWSESPSASLCWWLASISCWIPTGFSKPRRCSFFLSPQDFLVTQWSSWNRSPHLNLKPSTTRSFIALSTISGACTKPWVEFGQASSKRTVSFPNHQVCI